MLQGSDSGMYKDKNTILGTANLEFDTDNSNPFMWITKLDIINTFNFGININQDYKAKYPLTVALFPKLSEESYESNNYMTVQKTECLEEGTGVLVLNGKMANDVYEFTYNNIEESMNLFEDKSVIVDLK